jgi:hypothetical protein
MTRSLHLPKTNGDATVDAAFGCGTVCWRQGRWTGHSARTAHVSSALGVPRSIELDRRSTFANPSPVDTIPCPALISIRVGLRRETCLHFYQGLHSSTTRQCPRGKTRAPGRRLRSRPLWPWSVPGVRRVRVLLVHPSRLRALANTSDVKAPLARGPSGLDVLTCEAAHFWCSLCRLRWFPLPVPRSRWAR